MSKGKIVKNQVLSKRVLPISLKKASWGEKIDQIDRHIFFTLFFFFEIVFTCSFCRFWDQFYLFF